MGDINSLSYSSALRGLSAIFKVFISVLTILAAVILKCAVLNGYIIIMAFTAAVVIGKTPVRSYFRLIAAPLLFIAIAAAAVCINFDNGKIFISSASMILMINSAIAALAAVSSCYFLMLTTPLEDILALLERAGTAKVIIEIMFLMYRYIFILYNTARCMSISAKCRMKGRSFIVRLDALGGIVSSIFISSLKKAEHLQMSMDSRLFSGVFCSNVKIKSPCCKEIAIAAMHILIMAVIYTAVSVVL